MKGRPDSRRTLSPEALGKKRGTPAGDRRSERPMTVRLIHVEPDSGAQDVMDRVWHELLADDPPAEESA